jgi:hypothetical protein
MVDSPVKAMCAMIVCKVGIKGHTMRQTRWEEEGCTIRITLKQLHKALR